MARYTFGGSASDWTFATYTSGGRHYPVLAPATLTFWDAETGGTQLTVTLNGTDVTSVTVGADGLIPDFLGPDGAAALWADAGAGRVRMTTSDPLAAMPKTAADVGAEPAGSVAALNATLKPVAKSGAITDLTGTATDAQLPARLGQMQLANTFAAQQDKYAALAPLIYRMKRNEALKLGVSSSSTLMNPTLPISAQTGQQMWAQVLAKFGNTASTVEGRGASGAKVEHLLNGGVSPDMMPAEAAARLGYDAVLMNINYDNDTSVGTSADTFYQKFRDAIRAVQRTGCIPLVIPPLPAGVYFTGSPADYRTAVYKAAAETGALLFPIESTLLKADGTQDATLYQPDMIHPNATGAQMYGAAFAALWPTQPQTSAPAGRRPRGTYDDPQIVGPFFHWTDPLGTDRRSVWNTRKDAYDGRLASTAVLLDPATWARNTAFTSDLRDSGAETVYDCAKTIGEADGYLGSALGDATNDPPFIAGGGIASGTSRMFTVPVAGKRDVQFGRDNTTVRLVVSSITSNGQDQTLFSRRNLSGGNNQCRVYIENSSGDLVLDLGGNTSRLAGVGATIVGTGKTHVVTVTTIGTTGHVYIDGVDKGTITPGASNTGSAWSALPFRFMASITGGGGFAFWLNAAAVHWAEIANAYTDKAEDAAWIANRLKPALASRSLTWNA